MKNNNNNNNNKKKNAKKVYVNSNWHFLLGTHPTYP